MKKGLAWTVLIVLLVCTCLSVVGCNDETPQPKDEGDWWNDEFAGTEIDEEGLLEMMGGYAKGVCHPNENYEQIKSANIEWVRFDINHLPFDKDGNPDEGYLSFKERAKGYADKGMKVFAVTPYPRDYIAAGLDPRDKENWPEIMKIARFYAEDLKDIVSAFQITNEMGIDHFTLPLTIEEAADFIGIQLKAMYRYRGGNPIGYNLGGMSYVVLNELMEPYLQYVDYVGVDIYVGCFETYFKTLSSFTGLVTLARNQTKKPIIITEFGYIGAGQKKTDQEKLEILKLYGAEGDTFSDAENFARNNMEIIVNDEDFPERFSTHLKHVCEMDEANMSAEEIAEKYDAMGSKLFDTDLVSHIYRQLKDGYQLNDYEHTWDGQADFYTDLFVALNKIDYLCGAIVYCYSDSDSCYICSQTDCPVETGWGLVDGDGNPKPSYYAVQEAFGSIEK